MTRSSSGLLRSSSPIILPFLAPSIPQYLLRSPNATLKTTSPTHTSSRSLCVSSRRFAETAARAKKQEDEQPVPNSIFNKTPQSATYTDLVRNYQGPKKDSQTSNSSTRLDSLLNEKLGNRTRSPQDTEFGHGQGHRQRQGDVFQRMNFPETKPLAVNSDVEKSLMANRQLQERAANNTEVAPRNKRTVRSRPSVGRTVEVNPTGGVDFGRALTALGILSAREKVRSQQLAQRFHERPGVKRKRLRMQRWRVFFRQGFNAMVTRAKQMKKQGW